ncbi:5-carboxymethyl-2-hydroxymuconate delta-isomerase [Ochromonadaceae sp. CCMP2298]|nr:5-carboxymethyl-2-hydroxymuconate delta-isomerase [Ochromonadaceae sp. CCMP2298]
MNKLVKLVTFSCKQNPTARVGLMVGAQQVLDLTADAVGKLNKKLPGRSGDMITFISQAGAETVGELQALLADGAFKGSELRPVDELKLHAPVVPTRNVLCVGKNYKDHVAEMGGENSLPKHAIFFTKAPQAIVPTGGEVESHPTITKMLDYEAELAVIIGKKGRDIKKADALEYVFGYSIANDVTSRDLQKKHTQWFKGKTLDSSCPLGPCIVPAACLDASDLSIKLWVNGEKRQDSRTSNMIFSIPELIEQLSEGFTLYPGDILLTGTPDGVGVAMKPPQPLKAGDLVEIEVEHIGRLVNRVV